MPLKANQIISNGRSGSNYKHPSPDARISLAAKFRSFAEKSRTDQLQAIKRKLKSLHREYIIRKKTRAVSRILKGNLAAPQVLGSGNSLYINYRPDADVDFNQHPELLTLSNKWVANNAANNAGDLSRLYALLFNVKQVVAEGVPGDFAELGVYRGNSAAVLAHYARQSKRSTFLFDTYAGFEARDLIGIDGGKKRSFTETSLELVREIVGEESVIFVKGYFPQTITDSMAQRRFAVVHLDCDLYEPIRAGLEFFFPRLSPGGLMIIHDYSNPCWEGTKRAVDEYLPRISENLVLIPDKSGTAMIRKSRLLARDMA